MKQLMLLSFLIFFHLVLPGQDACTAYLPGEGTILTYQNYNAKGKETTQTITEVRSLKVVGDTSYFLVHQLITDGKPKNDIENELEYRCAGDVFVIDMQSVLNPEQLKDFEGTLVVKTENMYLPSRLEPGMELNDGFIEMQASVDYMTVTINARSYYRNVEAFEEVTTPAGTFQAYKIKSYVESKFAFMRVAVRNEEWYVPDVGVVKSESYDNKERLIGKSVLLQISQ